METQNFMVTDEFGHYICNIDILYEDLYWLKRGLFCTVQFGQIIIY
jgi:hypothetical protein